MAVKKFRSSVFVGLAALAILGTQAISTAAAANATGPLEESRLEDDIERDLGRGLPETVEVEVTCPANVVIGKGRKPACAATVEGQKLAYELWPTSERGVFRFKRTKAVIDLNRIQSQVARQVAQQMGGKWRIKCSAAGASRIYVVAVKRSFSCPIYGKDGEGVSRQGKIVYYVENLQGHIDWEAQ